MSLGLDDVRRIAELAQRIERMRAEAEKIKEAE